MTEFSSAITTEQSAFLVNNKAGLTQTEDGKRIWQNRVKMAGEAYNVAKAIQMQHSLTALDIKAPDDEDDCVDSDFPTWPTYRDNFIYDWIANRTIKTVEEADAMFEKDIADVLQTIESTETDTADLADAADQVETAADLPTTETAAAPVAKKRGRPAGSGKAKTAVIKKSYYKPKAKATKAVKAPKKAAAKKKSAVKGSASEKAQVIIEKYAARDWSRKDIIAKLQSQLDMGAAYASTLYQKFS